MELKNFFDEIPEKLPQEFIESLLNTSTLKIERIISDGQATPTGEWYDQPMNEWVILLKGTAGLLFYGDSNIIQLNPGDYTHIPSHKKHRVEWTDPVEKTIWLAIHYA